MNDTTAYVGLDVHKDTITVACVGVVPEAHVVNLGIIGTQDYAIDNLTYIGDCIERAGRVVDCVIPAGGWHAVSALNKPYSDSPWRSVKYTVSRFARLRPCQAERRRNPLQNRSNYMSLNSAPSVSVRGTPPLFPATILYCLADIFTYCTT